jgi:signal transduction histidine kinase
MILARGIVSVAPLVIAIAAALRRHPPRREAINSIAALAVLGAMTGVIVSLPLELWNTVVPAALVFPILLWLAARWQPVFSAAGAFIVSMTVALTAIYGFGHFGESTLSVDATLQTQAIILIVSFGTAVLAAVFAERRESEERLARSNMLLERERENKLMNVQSVIAAIAHEKRQPLAAITTNASAVQRWLERTPPDQDEARASLNQIKDESLRASEVFNGIRALFGKVDQERQAVDVNDIILSVTHSLEGQLNDHGVAVHRELAAELPLIAGHSGQLREVIFNLVTNALDAMRSTTNRSRVLHVRTELRDRDKIAVAIQDTGSGIDPTELAGIFGAFVTTKTQGTGLGLAICHMIVERHGGQLTASSDGKSGALFQFILPIEGTKT